MSEDVLTRALISEQYATIQGTGVMSGEWQYFVRFAGCSVMSCPIRKVCDQPESLGRVNGSLVSIDTIIDEAKKHANWLHITGGEPCDQPEALGQLTVKARRVGLKVQIQTSGLLPVTCEWDVLTVSPKGKASELAVGSCTEIVAVCDSRTETKNILAFRHRVSAEHYWIQSVWENGECDYEPSVALIAEVRELCGQEWKLTSQLHKHAGLK